MGAAPISSIIVAGGGIVAWSAAAALRRQLPAVNVTVVAMTPPPDALADRIGCTLPSIVEFHADLGLTDADTVLRAGSGFRLGTRFECWSVQPPAYVHAYGDYGPALGGSAFHQHWLRAQAEQAAAPLDAYCAAAVLGSEGRFVQPERAPAFAAGNFTYGLHIDPHRYCEMMRAFALHLGASERAARVADVRLRSEDGFIEALMLDDGSELTADLFVDATGPEALVRRKVDEKWEDWSAWLLADRIVIDDRPEQGDAAPLDRAIATNDGWRWEASSPIRKSIGQVYSSAFATAEPMGDSIALRPGRLAQPWLRNCVAIGDAAVAIEPLEWTNLHLAHSAIDRLVAMMPDRDCDPVELWDYNRQVNAEADRVRDFVLLHYAVSQRPGDHFWREAASRSLPDSLQHTLTQFHERGRLPFYEEETFANHSWVAVLLGQGVKPRRIDPLVDAVPPPETKRMLEHVRSGARAMAENAPPHSLYLRSLAQRERQ